ncbi:hypothetical protein JCM10296v2_001771 [Rhodotorula toruloides]
MAESDESLEALRARADELRRRITFLRASSSLSSFPSTSSASDDSIFRPPSTLSSSSDTQAATELARTYRLTGRSCFAVELARGNRAKEEMGEIGRERKKRKVEGKGKRKAEEEEEGEEGKAEGFARKGTAVRLETFFQGRYYEPYYIVFARRLPDLDKPAVDAELPIDIAHHTIPHWIPLDELSRRYLGGPLEGEETAGRRGDAAGQPDLELFLTRLTPYLNAFVSRREQLVSLLAAHSTSSHPSLHFRIFASEPCDRIVIEWQLPSTSLQEDEEVDEGKKRIVAQVAGRDLRAERFAERAEGEEVSLLVRYIEQASDGREARQLVLHTLTAATLQLAGKERTIEAVVRGLVDETTRAGWVPEG